MQENIHCLQSLKVTRLLVPEVKIRTDLIRSQIEKTIKLSFHYGLVLKLREIEVLNNLQKFQDSDTDLLKYYIRRITNISEEKIFLYFRSTVILDLILKEI